MPSKNSNNSTNMKEEQHPRSFQNPLNVHPATDHTIHQSTNSDHAKDVTEFITAEENVKWNIGRRSRMDTNNGAVSNNNWVLPIYIYINNFKYFYYYFFGLFGYWFILYWGAETFALFYFYFFYFYFGAAVD